MKNNGVFIVIEGSDGSGKATQFKLLTERLRAAGHDVDVYDFPQYDNPSSYFIKQYLNGEFGPASEISPYSASLFFALDRYEAAPKIRLSLSNGKIVLSNRYVGSNMAHQGAKFTKEAEQRGFFVWEDNLEYQLLNLPRPSLNIFLRVQPEISFELIKQKSARGYTQKSHDEHEADIEHLRSAVKAFDTLSRLFPKDFKSVECVENGKLQSITEINNKIWNILKPMLPKPTHKGKSAIVKLVDKPTSKVTEKVNSEPTPENKTNQLKDVSLLALGYLSSDTQNADIHWPRENKKRLYYFIPSEFSPGLTKKYSQTMDRLSDLHIQIKKIIDTKNGTGNSKNNAILHAATPLAALADAKVGERAAMTEKIKTSELPEMKQILKQLIPEETLVKQPSSSMPKTMSQILKELEASRLPHIATDDNIQLIDVWPRNEMDLLVDCLYPYSNLDRDTIAAELDRWTYEQKAEALKKTLAGGSAAALEKTRYSFIILESFLEVDKMRKSLNILDLQIQTPSPLYGYNVSRLAEDLGIDDQFIQCFDLSLELFSEIQSEGHEHLASYAVLLGHKQRWQFSIRGKDLLSIKTRNHIIKSLVKKVEEVHPLIANSIKPKTTQVGGIQFQTKPAAHKHR